MALVISALVYFLVASSAVSMIRVIAGPSVTDRMIGLNLVAAQILALLVVISVQAERTIYLDVALVYDIFGFIGILALTRYFSGRRGRL